MEKREDPSPEGAGMRAGPAHTRRIPHTLPSRQILQNSMVTATRTPVRVPRKKRASRRGMIRCPGTADPVRETGSQNEYRTASDPCFITRISGGNSHHLPSHGRRMTC